MSISKQHLAASLAAAAILLPLLAGAGHVADASITPTLATWSLALPSPGPASQSVDTFTDLPQGAKETYKGSGIFTAPVSSAMNYDINLRTQNNYGEYGITPESIPGLAIGSIYIKDNAANQFVELAVHERAAYTPFDNFPAPQILSMIIYEGKIQDTKDTFIQLPESVKIAFLNLPLAGEGDASTPKVAQMAELMTSKVDANWNQADQMLDAQGKLANFDIKSHFSNLTPDQLSQYTLGKTDAQTGHKTPDVITQGLQKMFGDQIVQNAGLPKGPAVWINAKIGGKVTPVLFQQYERVAITVNPNNIDSPTKITSDMKDAKNKSVVQVGLQGQIVYNGLLAVDTRPSATPTEAPRTATPKPAETATAQKPEASPTPALSGVEYKNPILEKAWLKRVLVDAKTDGGLTLDFTSMQALKDLVDQTELAISINTGKSVAEVEAAFAKEGYIDGVTFPQVVSQDERTHNSVLLPDPQTRRFGMKEIEIKKSYDYPPGAPRIWLGSARDYTIWSDGEKLSLVTAGGDPFGNLYGKYFFSVIQGKMLEILARIHESSENKYKDGSANWISDITNDFTNNTTKLDTSKFYNYTNNEFTYGMFHTK